MKIKYSVFFSVLVLICCIFWPGQSLAWEYITLRPEVNGTVNVREEPSKKGKFIENVWAGMFYGKAYLISTGVVHNDWLEVASVYYGYPKNEPKETRYAWVCGKYFMPADPEKDGFTFFAPTDYWINHGINVHRPDQALDCYDWWCYLVRSGYIFVKVGAKIISADKAWTKVAGNDCGKKIFGYVITDFFIDQPAGDVVYYKEAKIFRTVYYGVNIRVRADVKSDIIGKILYRYTEIKIIGEKFPWYKTKDGGWVFYKTVEQFPCCLAMN